MVMHKIMNAPEGQTLQRDSKLQMRNRLAARLYLNLLECYFIFVSFFSFPFFFSGKNRGDYREQKNRGNAKNDLSVGLAGCITSDLKVDIITSPSLSLKRRGIKHS